MPETDVNEQAMDLAKEVAKELAKDVYADAGRPVAKPTGELVGLVPRAIRAALAPVEKWVLQQEYNVAETKKLLEEKLQGTPPELIQPPEPHIAVPAIQYISYCMDNEELRDMYANLLANSMNSVVKNGVHPGFVEIIKQLCPDEAKFLKYMMSHPRVPTIGVKYRYSDAKRGSVEIIKDFSIVPQLAGCENVHDSQKYIDNLVRLGLLERASMSSLTDKSQYDPLKNHPYTKQYYSIEKAKSHGFEKCEYSESFVDLTAYGKSFCGICLSVTKIVTANVVDV